jgi:hypothetical protein
MHSIDSACPECNDMGYYGGCDLCGCSPAANRTEPNNSEAAYYQVERPALLYRRKFRTPEAAESFASMVENGKVLAFNATGKLIDGGELEWGCPFCGEPVGHIPGCEA